MLIHESNQNEKLGGDPYKIYGTPEWNSVHADPKTKYTPSTEVNALLKGKKNVDHPEHYNNGEIECIDAIKAALGKDGYESWLVGSVIKYLWRYKHKNGSEDIEKALWYLDRLVKDMKEEKPVKSVSAKTFDIVTKSNSIDKDPKAEVKTSEDQVKSDINEQHKLLEKLKGMIATQIDLMDSINHIAPHDPMNDKDNQNDQAVINAIDDVKSTVDKIKSKMKKAVWTTQ